MEQTRVLVNTTNGTPVPAGFVSIDANIRNTEEKKVSEELRYRNIVIRELNVPSVEDKFRPLVLAKLYELARDRFSEEMKNTNRMGKDVAASDYTVEALLVYYATEASNGRMTKEQIANWFKEGDTYAAVLAKKGEKVAQTWCDVFSKFASPNHGVNANDCRTLLAGMQPRDAESAIGQAIASKMNAKIAASETSLVEGL